MKNALSLFESITSAAVAYEQYTVQMCKYSYTNDSI